MDTKNNFTLKIVKHLLSNNFSVLLHNKESLDGYGGWLEADGDEKELAVAMNHHMGFEILLHEYCHFLQYSLDRNFWDDSNQYYDILFDWVSDQTLSFDDSTLNKSLDQAYNTLASLNVSLRTLATGLTAVETAFAQISAIQNQ
jgi:hypothetical protein